MGAFLFACLRQVPKTALETDEQLVSQVVVVDAHPFTAFTTESLSVRVGKSKSDESVRGNHLPFINMLLK
ncbi:MAG: hypothetical protein J6C62_00225 [Clostridia bacterium]|nr:hypothetical protein [Clostridia bacterium]